MQTKLTRNFLPRSLGVSPKFLQKTFMSRISIFFGDFNFDILLTVLDVFHVMCFIFFGGVTS